MTSLSLAKPAPSLNGPARRVQLRHTAQARVDATQAPRQGSLMKENPFLRSASRLQPAMAQEEQGEPGAPQDDLPLPEYMELLELPTDGSSEAGTVDDATDAGDDTSGPSCYTAPPITTLTINIDFPEGKLPDDAATACAAVNPPVGDPRLHEGWQCNNFRWSATCLKYRALYFEQINAERYGYSICTCLQPVISAGQFFFTIPILPYKAATECPRDFEYALGHYRPGSCAPRRCNWLPCDPGGVLIQAGTVAGLILLIP